MGSDRTPHSVAGCGAGQSRWQPLLVVALVLLAFGRCLTNGFTYDDFGTLVDNPGVHAGSPWQAVVDPETHTSIRPVRMYRPLRTMLFQAEHAVFGMHPAGFHLVSLVLHALVALQLLWLTRRLLGASVALPVALVFACHPLASEVVVSIKAQDDLLAANAMLWVCRRFVDGRVTGTVRGCLSVVGLAALALLSKESAVILPVLLATIGWARLPAVTTLRTRGLVLAGAVAFLTAAYLFVRHELLAAATVDGSAPAAHLLPTSLAHLPLYWLRVVWPFSLSADYSGVHVLGFGSGVLWISVLTQAAAAALLWRTRWPVVRAGGVFACLALAPGCNLLPGYVAVAERFAYLSIAGCVAVLFGLHQMVAARWQGVRSRRPLFIALLGVLCAGSFVRTGDWRDNETLFGATAASPWSSSIMQRFLVNELLRQGRTEEAAAQLPADAGAALSPDSARARRERSQAALLAMQRGQWRQAADVLALVVASPQALTGDWLNYGTALTNLGDRRAAETAFARVLAAEPEHAGALRMLGRLAFEGGDFASATDRFTRAVAREPGNANARYFLVLSRWRNDDVDGAITELRRAVADGVDVAPLIAADPATWANAPEALRAALPLRSR